MANFRGGTALQEVVNQHAVAALAAYADAHARWLRGVEPALFDAVLDRVEQSIGDTSAGGSSRGGSDGSGVAAGGAETGAALAAAPCPDGQTVRSKLKEQWSRPALAASAREVRAQLSTLQQEVASAKREKNVRLLVAAAQLTRTLGGVRVTMCKSAKDRTSMSVTYEQARLLHARHGVAAGDVMPVADVLRAHGVRRRNAGKNTGTERFAFNALQRSLLPVEFQPPKGTGGAKIS